MRLSLLLLPLLLALEPAIAQAQATTDAAPSPPAAADTSAQPTPSKAKPKPKKRTKKKVVKPAPADAVAPSTAAPAGPATSGQELGGAGAAVAPLPPREAPPPTPVPEAARAEPTPRDVAPAGDGAAPIAAAPASGEPSLRHLGLQLDAGFPGGAAVEVVFRPAWWLRASAGPAYNLLGWGLRAGVGLVPAQWAVTPTLNLDYGHFFGGDLNKFVTASTDAERAVLNDAAYDFFSGTIGVEFGSQRSFAFYLRGGLTFLWANVAAADAQALARQTAGNGTITFSDVKVRGLLPAFSLGFIWYLF